MTEADRPTDPGGGPPDNTAPDNTDHALGNDGVGVGESVGGTHGPPRTPPNAAPNASPNAAASPNPATNPVIVDCTAGTTNADDEYNIRTGASPGFQTPVGTGGNHGSSPGSSLLSSPDSSVPSDASRSGKKHAWEDRLIVHTSVHHFLMCETCSFVPPHEPGVPEPRVCPRTPLRMVHPAATPRNTCQR